jgi:type I restriction enzyme, S subunit
MKTRMVELGDVCDFLDSQRRPVSEELRKPGPYPYYGANGQQGSIDGFIFDEPLILLAEDGGHFGSPDSPIAYRISGKAWVNNHAHVLRPREGCDRDYLTHALNCCNILKYITGSTRPKLTKGSAECIRFPLPLPPEQRRIARQLEEADRLRRTRCYTLELSAGFLPATFRKLFGDSLRELPRWKPVPIAELCESITDCVNKTAPLSEKPTPFKMIRTPNVRNGQVDLSTVRYVSEDTFKTWTRRSVPQHGDIILTREAPLGEVGILKNPQNVFLGQRLVQYRVNPAKATPEYLLHALLSTDLQHQLKRLGAGSTVEHIAVPDCEALMVMKPPHDLQKHFTTLVTQHESLLATQRESLRQAEHLFQTLLHRAFSPD